MVFLKGKKHGLFNDIFKNLRMLNFHIKFFQFSKDQKIRISNFLQVHSLKGIFRLVLHTLAIRISNNRTYGINV